MAKKLNTGEVLNRINKKINELGNKILFLGFSNSFINTRSLKIKLKNIETNEEIEITYIAFINNGWSGKINKANNIKLAKRPSIIELTSRINLKIENLKKENINLKFLEFCEEINNEVNLSKLKIKLLDKDYNEIGTILYYSFLNRGWCCPKRKSDKFSKVKKFTDEKAIEKINNKINEFKNVGINYKFIKFKNDKWEGELTKFILEDLDNSRNFEINYNNFIKLIVKPKLDHSPRLYDKDIATELINKKIKELNLDCSFIGFKNNKWDKYETTKILLKSNKFGDIGEILYVSFMKGGWKSPLERNRYKNENICWKIIQKYNSNFKKGIRIKNVMFQDNSQHDLIPDFYSEKDRIIIEYDGKQHYEYIEFLQKSYNNFVYQVNRDKILENYCRENSIRLLRIPWRDEQNLEEIIKTFLLEGKDITTKVEPKLLPAVIIK